MTLHSSIGRFAAAATAALLALAFTGCSASTPTPESGGSPAPTDSSGSAAQMVSCLKAGGAQARISEHSGLLLVQTDAGFDIEDIGDGASVTMTRAGSSDEGSPGPIAIEDIDTSTGKAWVAYDSSRDLNEDPDLQDIYRQCEEKIPGFTQPQFSPESNPEFAAFQEQAQKDGLEFAKCARDEGFDWVEDPQDGALFVGENVTEDELRGALKACFKPDYAFGWGSGGNIDLGGILGEFMKAGGSDQ